jgi:hypothetical protein
MSYKLIVIAIASRPARMSYAPRTGAAALMEAPPAGRAAQRPVAQLCSLWLFLALRRSAVRTGHGGAPYLLYGAVLARAYQEHSAPASRARQHATGFRSRRPLSGAAGVKHVANEHGNGGRPSVGQAPTPDGLSADGQQREGQAMSNTTAPLGAGCSGRHHRCCRPSGVTQIAPCGWRPSSASPGSRSASRLRCVSSRVRRCGVALASLVIASAMLRVRRR